MDLLSALQTFVRVVEKGSFSAVAKERGVGQPRISKQIAALEEHLGTQLIRRTQRSVIVLEAGRKLYQAATRIQTELEETIEQLSKDHKSPHGTVRAAMPTALARRFVFPMLSMFLKNYPHISLDISSTDQIVNFSDQEVDLILHSGDLPHSNMFVKKIGETHLVTVATPALLERLPKVETIDDLPGVPAIVYLQHGYTRPWFFSDTDRTVTVPPPLSLRTGDPDQLRIAVLDGLGIAQAPHWLFAEELATGELLELFPERRVPKAVFLLWPRSDRRKTNARLFAAFLDEVLSKHAFFHLRG